MGIIFKKILWTVIPILGVTGAVAANVNNSIENEK